MQESQPNNIRKVALTSLAGTSIEWYDFFLYGTAAAIIFPKAFFPCRHASNGRAYRFI